jgi:hypothetical protein
VVLLGCDSSGEFLQSFFVFPAPLHQVIFPLLEV